MTTIRLMFAGILGLSAMALAQTPDPTQLCPYGGSAATQPSAAQGSASAACPVASSTNAQANATLNLKVVQGTPGAPAIGGETVSLGLFASGQVIDQVKVKLAPDGTLQVKGLPVSAAVQPIVSIDHAGATFTALGAAIDADHTAQQLQLTVYETTQVAPKWTVAMRHIITQPTPTGVEVMDMIAINSPADHAWIGKADATGTKQTVSLTLPPGATGVHVGGDLNDSGATFADGKLSVHQPLLPGDSKYQIQYTIPAVAGVAQLIVTAPTDVQHILVFVPKDGTTLTTTGLQQLDSSMLGAMGDKTRAFMATNLTAGQTISIKFNDLRSQASVLPGPGSEQPGEAAPNAAASAGDSSAFGTKVVAVGGAAVILVCGSSVVLLKAPKQTDRG